VSTSIARPLSDSANWAAAVHWAAALRPVTDQSSPACIGPLYQVSSAGIHHLSPGPARPIGVGDGNGRATGQARHDLRPHRGALHV
jgi:hypothetical protein